MGLTEQTRAFEKLCRERGLSMTVQRRTVLEELVGRRDHPTADQVYESVRERLPEISRTTVYRVLETFVAAGAARKVCHPDAVARFDPIVERHHHLVCEQCGTLYDLEDTEVPALRLPRTSARFDIHDYSINFTGVCASCRKDRKVKISSQTKGRTR